MVGLIERGELEKSQKEMKLNSWMSMCEEVVKEELELNDYVSISNGESINSMKEKKAVRDMIVKSAKDLKLSIWST
jgi:hypothetical protein